MKELSIRDKIFFKKSKLRQKVLDLLTEPKTATEIAREIGLHRSSISRILIDLLIGLEVLKFRNNLLRHIV